jgi:hypothetical protein
MNTNLKTYSVPLDKDLHEFMLGFVGKKCVGRSNAPMCVRKIHDIIGVIRAHNDCGLAYLIQPADKSGNPVQKHPDNIVIVSGETLLSQWVNFNK